MHLYTFLFDQVKTFSLSDIDTNMVKSHFLILLFTLILSMVCVMGQECKKDGKKYEVINANFMLLPVNLKSRVSEIQGLDNCLYSVFDQIEDEICFISM